MESIALIHYSCPPVVGGVEEIIRQQGSLFHRHEHKVKIIAGKGDIYTGQFRIEINPLLSSRHSEVLKLHKNAHDNVHHLRRLSTRILEYLQHTLANYDVLLAHNVLSMHYNLPLTIALHELAAQNTIKIVAWNHDSPFFYSNYSRRLNDGPWRILKKPNPHIHYITISDSRRHEFRKLYAGRKNITVIPNGIDPIRFFRLDKSTVSLIQEQNLFESDLIMVQPSRLHPRKNIELSIRVLRELLGRNLDARLILTGAYDPHERKTIDYYRKLITLARDSNVENNLIIVAEYYFRDGHKLAANRVTMRDLYLISDLLFLPSKQEGFGIPLLEAGMLKLPVVCSDIGPFRDIAGSNARFFSLRDEPGVIADSILNFLNSLAPHGLYRHVIRNHVWDNIYSRHIRPFLKSIA